MSQTMRHSPGLERGFEHLKVKERTRDDHDLHRLCRGELTRQARLVSFDRPPCKVALWLVLGDLDFYRGPPKITCMPKVFVQTGQFALDTCFLSGSPKFGDPPDRGCLCDQPQGKP